VSLEIITALGVGAGSAVIDVGGGASRLVDELLSAGFTDLSVLDVSQAALDIARRRLGVLSQSVRWLHEDVLTWEPTRRYDLWHDRAVFHFLVDQDDQAHYLYLLRRGLAPGGGLVMATFAADGPTFCSGLPTARYGPEELFAALGDAFEPVAIRREEHITPAGTMQPFSWLAARVKASHHHDR
jgi:SAM-dependent methyltransferase